jgi:hypothetical protein
MGQRALWGAAGIRERRTHRPCYFFLVGMEGQMRLCLRRREFIATLGGTAARAVQQSDSAIR